MFSSHAGAVAAQVAALPASVTVSGTAVPMSGNAGTVQLGAVNNTRATIVAAACRTEATTGTMTATLGGVAMTNVIQIFGNAGLNPVAIFILDTGQGSSLAAATSATLTLGGIGTIQRSAIGILRAVNLASLTPYHTNSNNTNQSLSMGINKATDGIAITGTYDGVNATNSWANMDSSQVVYNTNGTLNTVGYENVDADASPESINVNTLISTQRGGVAASWRGASNP